MQVSITARLIAAAESVSASGQSSPTHTPTSPSRTSAGRERLLFVSRSYPPIRGGLEYHNYRLHLGLEEPFDLHPLLNPKGKHHLPVFLLQSLYKLARWSRPGDRILFGDMLTAALAPLLRPFLRDVTFVSCAHGTDVIWPPSAYQLWIRRFVIPAVDAIIAVSGATRRAALARGAPPECVHVVPNGTDPVALMDNTVARQKIQQMYALDLRKRYVLLSVGRLVRRKGVCWFVREVFPRLPPDTTLLVAGDGPDRADLLNTVEVLGLQESVRLLGPVTDETRTCLYNAADAFVMPNQPVTGDMEGFGITLLEAASAGLPIVASELEGLTDAAAAAGTAYLVAPDDPEGFRRAIVEGRERAYGGYDPQSARADIGRYYSWPAIAGEYARIIQRARPRR